MINMVVEIDSMIEDINKELRDIKIKRNTVRLLMKEVRYAS